MKKPAKLNQEDIFVEILNYAYKKGLKGFTEYDIYTELILKKDFFNRIDKELIIEFFDENCNLIIFDVTVDELKKKDSSQAVNYRLLRRRMDAIRVFINQVSKYSAQEHKRIYIISDTGVYRHIEIQELQLAREQADKARRYSTWAIGISIFAVCVAIVQLTIPLKIKGVINSRITEPVTIEQSQLDDIESKLDAISIQLSQQK